MKIEKISDSQIRCTLNRADLLSREIKISELAYGTEKAKTLFHDMIEQASHQFGFEADEVPLMIEAIPVSPDCIVLIITKVDDPEELDTRFSRFAPSADEFSNEEGEDDVPDIDVFLDPFNLGLPDESLPNAPENDASETFIPINDSVIDTDSKATGEDSAPKDSDSVTKLFSFGSWDLASKAAVQIGEAFKGTSAFYKNSSKGLYFLALTAVPDSETGFFHACNICSEYGTKERFNAGTQGFLNEHCKTLITENAISILCKY